MPDRFVFRRDELYEQVWSTPMHRLARSYGMSDVALAKICKRLGVPVPGRGYWAKTVAGHEPKRSPLLPLRPGQIAEYHGWRRDPPAAPAKLSEDTVHRLESERATDSRIVVADTLEAPHRLVRFSAPILRRAVKERQAVAPYATQRCVHIAAGPELLDRALRIMDALLKAFAKRGFAVEVTEPVTTPAQSLTSAETRTESQPSLTRVEIAGERFEFGIEEGVERVPVDGNVANEPAKRVLARRQPPEWRRSGRLMLRLRNAGGLGIRHTWSDSATHRLEDCLNEFVRGAIRAADVRRSLRIDNERRDREERDRRARAEREDAERRARDAEERRLREAEQQRIDDLMRRVKAWRSAEDIRAFVAHVRDACAQAGFDATHGDDVEAWLVWALQHADEIDPTSSVARRPVAR